VRVGVWVGVREGGEGAGHEAAGFGGYSAPMFVQKMRSRAGTTAIPSGAARPVMIGTGTGEDGERRRILPFVGTSESVAALAPRPASRN